MKRYHITYFIDEANKTLTGVTIEAEDMADVIREFTIIHGTARMAKIKYIIEI